jgi:AAA15 family ATPase/GTPase
VLANANLTSDNVLKKTKNFIDSTYYHHVTNSLYSSPVILSNYFKNNHVSEFEDFLRESGINESLILHKDNDGLSRIYFKTIPPLPFDKVASSGTKELFKIFLAYTTAQNSNTPILVLDEFDAHYHFELAEQIILLLQKLRNTQVIFTSHNTSLLTNRIMRPDCCFIMTENKLTSFANATDRELREGHNLEKLYMSGEFYE